MKNQSIQMEIGTRGIIRKNAFKIQIKAALIGVFFLGSLIDVSVFAGAPEAERGAMLLCKQTAPVSALERLPSERNVPELKHLALANASLPDSVSYRETFNEDGHPVRLAVHHRGSGAHEKVLVLIHGVLADHEAWRYVAGELASDFDLWLVDLPGCGDSDKPDPDLLGPAGYSPTAMADRVLQALEQCIASRPRPPRLSIVAHSLGGMTTLRMLSDPDLRRAHSEVLKQIEKVVLLAPCDVAVHQEIPKFAKIIKLRGYEAAIGHTLGIIEGAVAESEQSSFCASNRATRETAENLAGILIRGDARRAAQAMLRQAVPWHEKQHRPDWDAIKRLEANYRNIDVPCLIIWGQCDEILPVSMGYKLKDQIEGARFIVLPDTMHAIQMERPMDCVRLIREFAPTPLVGKPSPQAPSLAASLSSPAGN